MGKRHDTHHCTSLVDNCLPSERLLSLSHPLSLCRCHWLGLMELAPKNTGNNRSHTDWARPNLFSNETLEVLVSLDESNGARSWELHAGLAQCISGSEVIFWVNLNGDHTLSTLDTCSGSDVLSERTSHTLGHTVCTGASCLLVFTKHVVGKVWTRRA